MDRECPGWEWASWGQEEQHLPWILCDTSCKSEVTLPTSAKAQGYQKGWKAK